MCGWGGGLGAARGLGVKGTSFTVRLARPSPTLHSGGLLEGRLPQVAQWLASCPPFCDVLPAACTCQFNVRRLLRLAPMQG